MSMKDLKRALRERDDEMRGKDARQALMAAHLIMALEEVPDAPKGLLQHLGDAREAFIAQYTLLPSAVVEIAARTPDAKED